MNTRKNKKKSKPPVELDAKGIGRRIRQIRGFELTQAEFGGVLGVGQAQLSKYELGLSLPTAEVLAKLRAYSGKSIDWIITGEEDPA
jgi:transcriptional regulator with XRE-family HTH domain